MTHIQNLVKLGWSNKEAQIYVAILKLGLASASEIAKKAKLKRTTVYNFLPDLVQKGFIKSSKKNRKRLYYIEDTRHLLIPLEEEKTQWSRLVQQLESIHNVIPDRPKIRFFEGENGVIQFFQETLERTPPGEPIYELIGPKAFYSKLPRNFAARYVPERLKRKIPIKIIATKSSAAESLANMAEKELRQIKLIEQSDFDGAIITYGNNVGLISLTDTFIGVTIENKAIADIQKASFQMLWNNLP